MKSINLNTRILKKYKMKLFNELVKLVLKDNIDQVNNLPKLLKESININIDEETITTLIRVIMGLDYTDKFYITLKDMVCEAINLNEVN